MGVRWAKGYICIDVGLQKCYRPLRVTFIQSDLLEEMIIVKGGTNKRLM